MGQDETGVNQLAAAADVSGPGTGSVSGPGTGSVSQLRDMLDHCPSLCTSMIKLLLLVGPAIEASVSA